MAVVRSMIRPTTSSRTTSPREVAEPCRSPVLHDSGGATRSTRSQELARRLHLFPARTSPRLDQKGVEFPKVLVADPRRTYRRAEVLPRPDVLTRARALRPADDRPCRLRRSAPGAAKGGYFANDDEAQTFEDELKAILVNQLAASTPRCGSTFALRRSPRVLRRVFDSPRSRTRWTRSSTGSGAKESSSAVGRARARTSRGSAPRRSSSPRAAMPRARCRSCAEPTPPPARSSPAARQRRRAAKMVVHDGRSPGHQPRVPRLVQGEGRGKGSRARGRRLRHVARLGRLVVDPVSERE